MKKQLRIAMLSVHSCPIGKLGERDSGGMSVYIRELARELGKRGHIVDIYTRVHDVNDDEVINLNHNNRLIHLKAGEDENLHKLMLYPHLTEFACNLENFRNLDGSRYDIIHSHYWLSGWVGQQLQNRWNIPHAIMFHTLGRAKNALGIGEKEARLRIRTEGDLVNGCHRIIAATENERDYLINQYGASPDKIGIVPCGVNLQLFQPVDTKLGRERLNLNGEKVILFVGRIDPLKGIENLILAASILSIKHRLKLVIVGGGDQAQFEGEKLQRLARELHVDNLIDFMGSVKHEDLPPLYSTADVCVVPSYYESFGLVTLESLACGTPVIATRVGGTESLIKHGKTGYIVEDNSPHCLADSIDALIGKQSNGAKPASYIRESIAAFSWSNIAEAMLKEYATMLATQESSLSFTEEKLGFPTASQHNS